MAKPRIIIADTEMSYVIPLQLKFVQEFFDMVELEIITDEQYFDIFFSTPQKADIFIVSEDLYSPSLQKHNFTHVFMLNDEYEEESTADLNINHILKYTSIVEVFNNIIGISADVLKVKVNDKKEPQIILVYSACGGVGKSTVAFGISAALTNSYKKTLYINASHLQTFQRMLNNSSAISSADVYVRLAKSDSNLYKDVVHTIRNESFNYLPPFKASLMSLGLTYKVYENMAISAKQSKDYDFIVVDADSVFDEDKANLINIADKVIIVTTQAVNSVYATNVLATNINGMNSDKYLFICNNFRNERNNALISADMPCHFTVNEYIEHINNYDQLSCSELGNIKSIQKTAYLVL